MSIILITSQDNWHKGWFLKQEDLQVAIDSIRNSGITVEVKNVDSVSQLEKLLDNLPSEALVWANAYYVDSGPGEVAWLNGFIAERDLKLFGSSSQTLLDILEKDVCQTKLEEQGIPVPPFIVITRKTVHELEDLLKKRALEFPLVVKPTTEGGSLGVKLVENLQELNQHTQYILDNFPESNVIIEAFLASDDITCGYFRLGDEALLMPSYYVIKNAPGTEHILSRENQFRPWDDDNKMQFVIEDPALLAQIRTHIPKIVDLFQIRELTRIDGRLDSDGILRFYDINGYPGLRYSKSVLTKQCAHYFPGYSEREIYDGLLNTILYNAFLRYGMEVPSALKKHNLFTMKSEKAIKINL